MAEPKEAKVRAALTDAKVRAAQPGDTLRDYSGSHGDGRLMLVVSTHGVRSWIYRQRRGKNDTTKKLGRYPEMTLAEARKEATRLGGRPEPLRRAGSFGKLLDEYVQHLRARGAASANDTDAEFKRSIPESDPIRSREARSITTAEIAAILRRKRWGKASGKHAKTEVKEDVKDDAKKPSTRVNRLRSMLSAAFNHASKHDYDPRQPDTAATFLIQHNPVLGTARIPEWERTRDRVLTRAEAQAFWQAMSELNGTEQRKSIGAFWRVVLLTGQRVTQLHKAQAEGDLLILTDSKGRGAKPKRHALPMTPRIAELWPATALVRAPGTPEVRAVHIDTIRQAAAEVLREIVEGRRRKAPVDEQPEDAEANDIRRTIETVLKDLGVSREDRAELLSHGRAGVQATHYERSDFIEPKLRALRLWEEWLFTDEGEQ